MRAEVVAALRGAIVPVSDAQEQTGGGSHRLPVRAPGRKEGRDEEERITGHVATKDGFLDAPTGIDQRRLGSPVLDDRGDHRLVSRLAEGNVGQAIFRLGGSPRDVLGEIDRKRLGQEAVQLGLDREPAP
jgi:hypothetical protein